MSKRRAPPQIPSIKRSGPTRQPKVEFVIACEGIATEPYYLRDCADYYGVGAVRLRVLKERGVPLTVVNIAIEERERLMEEYRREPGKNGYGFVVWAVFDRDEHPGYEEAIELAHANNILLAVSNPCFELWPFLHVSDCAAHIDRHQMQSKLAEVAPPYHHDDNPIIEFARIADRVEAAERRAKDLDRVARENSDPYGNPTTGMHYLVRSIINNGRRQPRSS